MNSTQSIGGESLLRRYEYEDRWVVAADLGVDDDDVSVDTVGSTAIVVVDHGDDVSEAELDLPDTADSASVTNGVLTIEVEK